MARTLSDRLSEAALGAFVGREDELRALTDVLQAPDPPFAVDHPRPGRHREILVRTGNS